MASKFSCKKMAFLALVLSVCVQLQPTLGGEVTCEQLDEGTCAFAVSSTGKRCVLEKHVQRSGEEGYTCRASEIEADKITNWVETDHCITACGLDRRSFGISSDSLLDSRLASKLCSPPCYGACPNVVDLYFNLAAGEGVFLPKFCEALGKNVRREMVEIRSSGLVAPGPVPAQKLLGIPAMAPF